MKTLEILSHLKSEANRLHSTSKECFQNWNKEVCADKKIQWWDLACLYSSEGDKVLQALTLLAETWALD